MGETVRVLVGQRAEGQFRGFWAEFEGEEVSSYEDTRGEKNIVYKLYMCTAYDWEAYRVHITDETNPQAPVYELLPYSEDSTVMGIGQDYTEPFDERDIVEKYPLFLKDMGSFRTRHVDPRRL